MANQKIWDGNQWIQTSVGKQEFDNLIGNVPLETTAQTVIPAINEINTQLAQIEEDARFKGVRLKLTSDKNIVNVTQLIVPWDAEEYDTDGFFSLASPTKIIIPAGVNKVQLRSNISISANATGIRQMSVRKNGNLFAGTFYVNTLAMPAGLISQINASSAVVNVVEGDEFTLQVYQNSGATLSLQAIDWTWLELIVIE